MVASRSMVIAGCLCAVALFGGCQVAVDVGGSVADSGTGGSGGTGTDAYVIGVENETDRNVVGPLREAVAWWDRKDDEYAAAWEGEFVVRPDADDPDLVARFAASVDCEGHASACAPEFNDSARLELGEGTMRFALGEIPNRPGLVKSLKHELGHVRGVSHCEPPHWLMGCPGSAEHEGKDFETREFPWRRTNLTVYLDSDDPEVREDVRVVLDEYETSPETPADLRVRFVDDPWLAHIVLSVDRCADCDRRSGTRRLQGGQSYGTDDGLEFLYWADISVTTPKDGTKPAVRQALELVLAPEGTSDASG